MASVLIFQTDFAQWQCTDSLPLGRYREVIQTMNLSGSKWDTQIGDNPTLAPYAVIFPDREWRRLATISENLSLELGQLEDELKQRQELWPRLGLKQDLLRALQFNQPWTPAAARVVRYDFHPTNNGWKLSEVNSDVPGGFIEASLFTQQMAENFPGLKDTGDPLAMLADSLAASAGKSNCVALLCAPGHTEDWQVTSALRDALQQRGVGGILARPEQLTWIEGRAYVGPPERAQLIGCIYRFYQGEWLPRTATKKWTPMLRGGVTPVCNPGFSILSESKRFPLLWSGLNTKCPTWLQALPAAATPWSAIRDGLTKWVLKPAYGNTGENIVSHGWQPANVLIRRFITTLTQRNQWVAQHRFETLSLSTPQGPRYPCIGVYTINGTAAGIYARLSPKPVIDYSASDVAILLRG